MTTTDFAGHRMTRHQEHMSAVRAVQRRHQLERVRCVLVQYVAWQQMGILPRDGDGTIAELRQLHTDIEAQMRAEGQEP